MPDQNRIGRWPRRARRWFSLSIQVEDFRQRPGRRRLGVVHENHGALSSPRLSNFLMTAWRWRRRRGCETPAGRCPSANGAVRASAAWPEAAGTLRRRAPETAPPATRELAEGLALMSISRSASAAGNVAQVGVIHRVVADEVSLAQGPSARARRRWLAALTPSSRRPTQKNTACTWCAARVSRISAAPAPLRTVVEGEDHLGVAAAGRAGSRLRPALGLRRRGPASPTDSTTAESAKAARPLAGGPSSSLYMPSRADPEDTAMARGLVRNPYDLAGNP